MRIYLTTLVFILFSVNAISQVTIGSGSLAYSRQIAKGTMLDLSSGSMSHSRDRGFSSVVFPNEESIIPEDFFNYHKHQITIPSAQDVALSIDYNDRIFDSPNELLVQVGIATQPAYLRTAKQNKVNIALVVDVSTSMSGVKIELVKKALRKFISSLQNEDVLSIITFSSEAQVVFPINKVGEHKAEIDRIIDKLTPNGMTNLNAGMMLGYDEVIKKHSDLTNSRVILMTDGETNVGERSHEKIIENSVKYNKEGIEISTIGIGQSLDFDLLRQLADRGKGSNYYIGEHDEDIYKVFDQELDGLLYKIGSNQELDIQLPEGWSIEQCYGYDTKSKMISPNKIKLKLENLGASSTRIALLKVTKNRYSEENIISARLSYSREGEKITLDKQLNYSSELHITNKELRKNYEIAFMAQTLKDACKASQLNRSYRSRSMIEDAVNWMKESPFYSDVDFQRVFSIIKEYKSNDESYETERPSRRPHVMH